MVDFTHFCPMLILTAVATARRVCQSNPKNIGFSPHANTLEAIHIQRIYTYAHNRRVGKADDDDIWRKIMKTFLESPPLGFEQNAWTEKHAHIGEEKKTAPLERVPAASAYKTCIYPSPRCLSAELIPRMFGRLGGTHSCC